MWNNVIEVYVTLAVARQAYVLPCTAPQWIEVSVFDIMHHIPNDASDLSGRLILVLHINPVLSAATSQQHWGSLSVVQHNHCMLLVGYAHRRTLGFKEGESKQNNEEIQGPNKTYVFTL